MESKHSKNSLSKDQYQFLLNNIDELIGIISPEYPFVIELINEDVYYKRLKYSQEELIGSSFLKIIGPSSKQKVINNLERIGNEILEEEFKATIKSSNEEIYGINLHVKPYLDQKNHKKLFVKLKGFSKQKLNENKFSRNGENFQEIVDNIPEIQFWNLLKSQRMEDVDNFSYLMLKFILENMPYKVYWKDKDLIYLGCNRSYAQFVGLDSASDIIGKKDANLFYKQERMKNLEEKEKKVIKSKTPQYNVIERWEKNNRNLFLEVNRIPLLNSNNEGVGILVIYNDITSFKESEQKFRKITEQSLIGIAIVQNEKLKYLNQQFAEIFGYNPNKKALLLDQPFRKIIHKKEREKIKQQLENNNINRYQFMGKTKKNKIIWLKAYSKKIKYEGNHADLITIIDITEKKRYEELLTKLNIDFLKFTPDILTNIKMLLETCKELIGCKLCAYIHKDSKKQKFQVLTNESKSYSYYNTEDFNKNFVAAEFFQEEHDVPQIIFDINQKSYVNKDKILKSYDIKGAYGKLIESEDGFNNCLCMFFESNPRTSYEEQLVLFSIASALQIEQKRWKVQQELKNQNEILNKMNEMKNDLITRTSHELKTPLISIKGFTNLLLEVHKEKMNAEMISIVESIEEGANRLQKIVKTFLKSLKLEQGEIDLNRNKHDLVLTIEQCVNQFEGFANLRNHTMILDLDEHLITKYDNEKIKEVLSNLLVNAIKYTPPNGTITISSEVRDDKYIISVEDTGIGFTKDEKEKLFTQFGKIERYGFGLDLDVKGIGLGLYISKNIIELHNGRIWMESEGRNEGSIFSFSLPII